MRLHTPLTELSVAQLEKYQNYTVQVSALTRVGEGARSRSVYCRTNEDLPSPPANIKAVPLSPQSILVTWLPPLHPAGEITGYAIHLSTMMAGQTITDKIEVGGGRERKRRLRGDELLLQVFSSGLEKTVRGLVAGQPYSFCVTAVTIVGEGGCGRVVVETPRLPHKPLISSLSRHYDALINTATSLTCRSVGNPRPTTSWTWK